MRRRPNTRKQGQDYEQTALEYLEPRGFALLARNFSARTGEIDLIGRHAGCLVFVEVRARSNPRYCSARASVNCAKQQRILRTAQVFLQRHQQYTNTPCRFDVIAFEPPQSGTELEILWLRGAFTA